MAWATAMWFFYACYYIDFSFWYLMECQTRPSSLSVRGGGRCVQEQLWMVDGGMSGRVTRWGHNQIIAVFMNVTNNKNRSLGQSTQISTRMSAIGTKSHLLNRWFDDHLRKKTDNYYYTVEEEEELLFGSEDWRLRWDRRAQRIDEDALAWGQLKLKRWGPVSLRSCYLWSQHNWTL